MKRQDKGDGQTDRQTEKEDRKREIETWHWFACVEKKLSCSATGDAVRKITMKEDHAIMKRLGSCRWQ